MYIFIFDFRVSFADPVAVRHALEILAELATRDPYAVAMSLGGSIDFIFKNSLFIPICSHFNEFVIVM